MTFATIVCSWFVNNIMRALCVLRLQQHHCALWNNPRRRCTEWNIVSELIMFRIIIIKRGKRLKGFGQNVCARYNYIATQFIIRIFLLLLFSPSVHLVRGRVNPPTSRCYTDEEEEEEIRFRDSYNRPPPPDNVSNVFIQFVRGIEEKDNFFFRTKYIWNLLINTTTSHNNPFMSFFTVDEI